jgi:formate dehydrogenase subunit gamma
MIDTTARRLGALMVGAALLFSTAVLAQAPQTTAQKELKLYQEPSRDGKDAPTTPNPAKEGQKPKEPQVAPAAAPGSTAVPGWNNPPAWGGVSESRQYASIPGVDRAQLIQGAGRQWRAFRNGVLTRYAGWIFVLVLAALTLFYLIRGPLRLHGQPTGRLIERFNAVERTSHWTLAISFVLLGLTGVVILWGKYIILPWLGYSGFSWLTVTSKNLHNFVGPLFIFSLVVMFLLYVKDNFFRSYDWAWIKKAGGMFGGAEVPSGRFNAGEKAWFWLGIVVFGTLITVSGLILDFPNWNQGRELMQQANVVHGVIAVLFIAVSFGHAYLGTIGMPGAYRAMRDGYVDETWAREHHGIWYDEVKAGKRPEKFVSGAAQPVAGDD